MKVKSICLLAAVLIMGSQTALLAQTHISGFLSGTLPPDTYIVDDSIFVRATDSLLIEPGASLQFTARSAFIIYGWMQAIGTAQDSIFFVPSGPDSGASIIFQTGSSPGSQLSYCHVRGFNNSGINAYYVDLTISHCLVTGNLATWGGGIYLSHANANISDCEVSGNLCIHNGGGIYCTGASPIITNCLVSGNICNLGLGVSGHGGGGLCANHLSNPRVTDCVFSNNHSGEFGGGLSLSDYSLAEFTRCLFSNNTADSSGGGAAILAGGFSPSAPVLTNCTFAGNSADSLGGGLFIETSYPTIINSIIEGSQGYGAIHFINSPNTILQYCDVYNPLTDNFAGEVPPGLGQLDTINANLDSCDAFFNILVEPLFVNPPTGDYHLSVGSPCIDAGDPTLPLDPDSTIADIGAFYFDQNSPVIKPRTRVALDNLSLMRLNPNPFNQTTAISYQLSAFSRVDLRVFDVAGRLVSVLVGNWQEPGAHQVIFDASNLASGVYLYRINAGSVIASGKMVLLK
jgi:predicted outer membrane repeat protein